MFAKDLIEPLVSRCGYGDILVWWGLPVTPLDPALCVDDYNIPDSEDESIPWDGDENGKGLEDDKLQARHDFSLLLLRCAWRAPWNVESHHSFQKPFRNAVKTLYLCANRIAMPVDIAAHVCSYLRRDWWHDERAHCFFSDCMEKRASKLLQQKLLSRVASVPRNVKGRGVMVCPGCEVTSYCCEEHKRNDFYRDNHKFYCDKPPFRIPGPKENELFNAVLRLQKHEPSSPLVLNERVERLIESQLHFCMEDTEDDDSGSWESVDTEEDVEEEETESLTLTSIVYKFFQRELYRHLSDDDDDYE